MVRRASWHMPWTRRTRYISQTIQDIAIVTVDGEYELVGDLSNGAISNDLEPCFQGHITLWRSQKATDAAIVTIEGE